MRKIQNIVSNFGNVIARQGKQLVVRIETLRSLCALSPSSSSRSALHSYASLLASWLSDDVRQVPANTWNKPRIVTAACFSTAIAAVVKQDQRRHEIMCHRTAA